MPKHHPASRPPAPRDPSDPDADPDSDAALPESDDEQALDQLADDPTPRVSIDSDVIIEASTLPTDLPGRADHTDEDLSALFDSTSPQHLANGFTGSGDEDGQSISQNDGDDKPDLPDHPAGA